jgi:hypothetical protein
MADEFRKSIPTTPSFRMQWMPCAAAIRSRAKELLTLLLKTDQNNPTYWIWLSAAVDAPKERIYCLQTALKLDPENGTAKRGLILLGALAPDETVPAVPDEPSARMGGEVTARVSCL